MRASRFAFTGCSAILLVMITAVPCLASVRIGNTPDNLDLPIPVPIQNYAVIDISGTNNVTMIALDDSNNAAYGFGTGSSPDELTYDKFQTYTWQNGTSGNGNVTICSGITGETDDDLDWWDINPWGLLSTGAFFGGVTSFDGNYASASVSVTAGATLIPNKGGIPQPPPDGLHAAYVKGMSAQGNIVGQAGGVDEADGRLFGFIYNSNSSAWTIFDYYNVLSGSAPLNGAINSFYFDPHTVNDQGWAIGWTYQAPTDLWSAALWTGTSFASLGSDAPMALNNQNQVVVQESAPGEGYLWESETSSVLASNGPPEVLWGDIFNVQPFSISNQKVPGSGSSADHTIEILATARNREDSIGNSAGAPTENFLWSRDNSGNWSFAKMVIPNGITIASYNTINSSGVIAAIGTTSTSTGNAALLLVPVELAVDGNRDGTIDLSGSGASDQTTEDKPYRFWLNDDSDPKGASGTGADSEVVPPLFHDSSFDYINSERDLEDWTRLWINIGGLQDAITSGKIQVGLKWKQVDSGSPAIKIVAAADTSGSDGYIKDDGAAAAQAGDPGGLLGTSVVFDKNGKDEIDTGGTFILSATNWTGLSASNPTQHFLFEAVTEGKGQLELVFFDQSGNQIGEGGSLWLDLKNIKKMYQRGYAKAGNTNPPYDYGNPPGPHVALSTDPNSAQMFDKAWDETPQCIVVVHGFNTTYDESTNSAETVFKRLWWRGYKGRVAAFRWALPDGIFNGTVPLGALGTYNDQEYFAWNSGTVLKQFVTNSFPSNYTVDIIGHSMGNMVVGEALRDGMQASHYAMLHAASSASCYRGGTFAYQITNTAVQTADTDSDPGTKNLSYLGWLGAIGGNPVNFCDPNDTVVGWKWDANNSAFKPQRFVLAGLSLVPSPWVGTDGYYYDPTATPGQRMGFTAYSTRFVNDPTESKPYVDFSRTGTIGGGNKQTDMSQAQGGAIGDHVDDSYFGDNHGNEWDWNIQDVGVFYWRFAVLSG